MAGTNLEDPLQARLAKVVAAWRGKWLIQDATAQLAVELLERALVVSGLHQQETAGLSMVTAPAVMPATAALQDMADSRQVHPALAGVSKASIPAGLAST